MVFLEAMARGSPQDRFTDCQLYNVLYQELLVAALPGMAIPHSRHPESFLTAMLVALEHLVVCAQTPRYYRVFSWWLLVQNWATLRFSDHTEILPSSVKIDVTGFSAQLTRSKTLGDDRTVASRPLVIDRCCYLAVAGWMQEGWRLLKDMADYPRDYLIPFPSSNLHGCRRRELSFDTASAMQNRVLRMVKSNDEFLFCPSATRFWTPHSNRTFMPSATATLGFEKSVRDFLGGWSAQASERYAHIAAQRIRNMQRTVVAELQKDLVHPLAEAETLVQFDGFLSEQGVPEEERSRCVKLLERGVRTEVPRASGELQHQEEEPELSSAPYLTEVAAPVLQEPQHKGRLGEAFVCDVHRMSLLRKSPKRGQSQYSSRARTWLLHFLFRKEEGTLSPPAGQVLPPPWGRFHELHLRRKHLPQESMTTSVGSAPAWVFRTMETRPRWSHHRPRQENLDTRSLPLPKHLPPTIAAALQSGPGRVWTPVLVRDQPWLYDSASRSHLSSSCWGFFGFLVFGLSPVPGLAFPGVSALCVRGCACAGVCVCVCWCSVPGPLWSLLRFCVACAVAVAPFGAVPCVSVCWRLPRVGFPVPFLGFFLRDLARHMGGRTSPRLVRISFGSPQS